MVPERELGLRAVINQRLLLAGGMLALLAACTTNPADTPSGGVAPGAASGPRFSLSSRERLPVGVPAFEGERSLQGSITEVIRKDLEISGLFRQVDGGSLSATEGARPDYAAWKSKGAGALLAGSVVAGQGDQLDVRFRLHDVTRGSELFAFKIPVRANQSRMAGHYIADKLYEQLTGLRGYFSSQIAYVEKRDGRYALMIADFDGENATPAMISDAPIISPAWSPDGKSIAYVGFDKKKPIVYIRNLAKPYPTVLANFKGSNSAPAWAPDGRRLAISLTKDGVSQIYLINADGSGARRLMNSASIDTEPQFSPDGRQIYFTSDRSGSPQIYRIAIEGGTPQRITVSGAYNVTPRISPDGKILVYVSRNEGRFQIAMLDLVSQQTQVLTDSAKDESPSFAPDGRTVLYATESAGRGVLSIVSIDGRTRYRLSIRAGDVRESAWRPI